MLRSKLNNVLMYVLFGYCTAYVFILFGMLCSFIYVVAAAVLQWIDERVVEALKASLAERTVVLYGSQVTLFLFFVLWAYGSAPFLPVSDQVLCKYLVWQSMTVDPKQEPWYLLVGDSQLSLGLRTSLSRYS
jgi:hypothetical protein